MRSSGTSAHISVVTSSDNSSSPRRHHWKHPSPSCRSGSSSSSKRKLMIQEYPPHVLAQKFNNKGALHLEDGNYARAIPYLAKALQLTEETAHEDWDWELCGACCSHCRLESCMMASGQRRRSQHGESAVPHQQRKQSLTQPSALLSKVPLCNDAMPFPMSTIAPSGDSDSSFQKGGGYLYRQPLFVHSTCIQEEHDMGPTLSLVVVFNLALAYQLVGNLQKSRRLYELCYQLQLEDDPQSSLWFTMCLSNNLSVIHHSLGDHAKYVVCLQHLLSTMMYMVDCQLAASAQSSNERIAAALAERRLRRQRSTTSLSLSLEATAVAAAPMDESHIEYDEHMMKALMDGFFRTVSKLILVGDTAAAA